MCDEGLQQAYFPVLAFVVCYVGFFYFLATLVKEVSAVFEALINAVVTPASAIAFSFTWLLQADAEPLTGTVLFSSSPSESANCSLQPG